MEFGAREMMIALGALVALAIMLDVIRRVRNSRYEKIHMPRRKQPVFDDDDLDDYGSELPGGGSRVVSYRDEADVAEVGKTVRERAEANKPKLSIPTRESELEFEPEFEPEQPSLNLNEPADSDDDSDIEELPQVTMAGRGTREEKLAAKKQIPVASVVVLHLMAREGEYFPGDQLLNSLLNQGLRYGSMKIFHRHTGEDGSGPVMYSVANSINPGTFDLNSMDQLVTPGISLFFAMEDVDDPAVTLGNLLASAKQMAIDLNGELKDESRSALTRQTEDHYRQRITDFSRAQLSGIE
ncbi:MAG TPA: cell division protein ZipA [Porticoccus sp.]|nr:cell division protein ZipA [Porticoccus sp.]